MMLRIAANSPNFVVARFRDKEELETQEEHDAYRDDMLSMIVKEALRPQDQAEL